MATWTLSEHCLQTTQKLGYVCEIQKIPEAYRVDQLEHFLLPCSNDNSMLVLCDNPFDRVSVIYRIKNLCKHVLTHLKTYRKYYTLVSTTYLSKKKLDFVNWLSSMMTKRLPADELCLHAIATYMNIHITVDYLRGIWTMLDLPQISHDLAKVLADIHLVYRGSCKFKLLCRKTLLGTIGHKLLLHKTEQDLPKVMVKLYRVDNWNRLAKLLINEYTTKLDRSNGETTDSEVTEIYEYCENKWKIPEVSIIPWKVIEDKKMINYTIKDGLHISTDHEHTDSDSTEIYETYEKETGTIYFLQMDTKKRDSYKHQSLPLFLYFKCPYTNCIFRSNKWKVTNNHYRLEHKKLNKCKYCKKTYNMPHSVNQHLYTHKKNIKGYLCKTFGNTYPFHSQLLIHRIKHTRKYREECTECSLTFKYWHDMLKHCWEHSAKELKCDRCEYTGTLLNLKSHKKQHDTSCVIMCPLCNEKFKYRMALWRHTKTCRRSGSPEY